MARAKKQHLKRRKDGRFACRYHDKWFMGDTEEEALQRREEFKRQEAAGAIRQLDPTVQEYAMKWLPLHKSTVSDKCYNDYAKQLEALCSVVGDKKMSAVSVDDAALVWKHYSGYSASTVKRSRMLFVALFDAAIENDLCRKNPFRARFAQPPKAPSGSHRALTDQEIHLIRTVPHRMQLAALVMLYAGLRRGEVLALSTRDIDLTAGTISVSRAVRFSGNRPTMTKPKTAAGKRTVPILSVLRPYLADHSGLIVSTVAGTVMTDTAFRRCWDSYLLHLSNAAGETVAIRPHDLRHTYCTMLRDSGVDMKQAMIWMGHSDEKMILHVYDHVSEKRTQNSVDQVEKMLLSRQNGRQTEDGST